MRFSKYKQVWLQLVCCCYGILGLTGCYNSCYGDTVEEGSCAMTAQLLQPRYNREFTEGYIVLYALIKKRGVMISIFVTHHY